MQKSKDKNQSGQQQKQEFTDQGKINVLKYKKANISTKNKGSSLRLTHVLLNTFLACLPLSSMFSLFAFYASTTIGSLLFLYYKANLLAWFRRQCHKLLDRLKNSLNLLIMTF